MVDTGIFATTDEVIRKAGADASAVSATEAYINDYMTQVESLINIMCRKNYSDTYTTLSVDVKGILKEVSSNLAAIYVLEYDFGTLSREEAEDRIIVLRDAALRGMSLLRDKEVQRFINGA